MMKLALLLLAIFASQVAGGNIRGSAEERRSCPHFQHIGCLSDVLEKACENEFALGALEPESVWMCCCPEPYHPCAKADRDATCDKAIHSFLKPQEGGPDLAVQANHIVALQQARGVLVSAHGNCKKFFAPELPHSKCGSPSTRTIERADIFCETVTWQWEELGDGNPEELARNACPLPKRKASESEGGARKGQQLEESQSPLHAEL